MTSNLGWLARRLIAQRINGGHFGLIAAALIAACSLGSMKVMADVLRFPADEWVTECEIATPPSECSLIGVFRGTDSRGNAGSFAVVIGLDTVLVAVVGQPFPQKAIIRIDKYPPAQCIGARYCVFDDIDSRTLISQLSKGAIILIDVFTTKSVFQSSLSTKGYRAGIAKIRASIP